MLPPTRDSGGFIVLSCCTNWAVRSLAVPREMNIRGTMLFTAHSGDTAEASHERLQQMMLSLVFRWHSSQHPLLAPVSIQSCLQHRGENWPHGGTEMFYLKLHKDVKNSFETLLCSLPLCISAMILDCSPWDLNHHSQKSTLIGRRKKGMAEPFPQLRSFCSILL